MTTILLATDFSLSAHWATDYARQLAERLHARLVLLHVYDPLPTNAPAHEWLTSTAEAQYVQAIHQLTSLRHELMGAAEERLAISIIARPGSAGVGSPADTILEVALREKADLLVMGLVGDHPHEARLQGSLATGLIPHTPVPLLLVPPGATYHAIQNMVLALDLSAPINSLALDTARQFARLFQATIDIICVEDEPTDTQRVAARHVRKLLQHDPHTFCFLPGYDLPAALDAYFAEAKADLIMLLPKGHTWLHTFLLESVTQQVARLATVPVLAAA
ncbi:universal stress protein [Fibrella sp. HMF5335]|uniref:Universal stress protein n=1 Tax=Fibrella rubiginis TaxID=2817060 RepID=A0A939GEN1_9BACT|nr:universal stress protein [Fibrella rubiginis]MBO0935415.1 universal stress protein [Fibrella rubiginis]